MVVAMGIKDTDDYLTVRFANPETGQVSPSIYGGRTPRTPLNPGEALELYDTLPASLSASGGQRHTGRGPIVHAQKAAWRQLES